MPPKLRLLSATSAGSIGDGHFPYGVGIRVLVSLSDKKGYLLGRGTDVTSAVDYSLQITDSQVCDG
ncbi:hypothetical protein CV102_25160 [Natronococcus pandeyae]|uniref:Uncharacterized protein n=1 Tax=Natronococcus pandeyae TaxID=2055836 RepID=A0A8J8TPH8_9EURY|nr:hypothetical protein CV102_25160 [Natronococcus pandeyae]